MLITDDDGFFGLFLEKSSEEGDPDLKDSFATDLIVDDGHARMGMQMGLSLEPADS